MKILFLDDHKEILDTYKMLENPALMSPGRGGGPKDLFDAEQKPEGGEGFVPIQDIYISGTYFDNAHDAINSARDAKFKGHPFRIAVLDMQLPELSGLEVAKRFIAMDMDVHFIFITAFSNHTVHDIARELGMSRNRFMFLKKPFELQEVIQTILYVRDNIHREEFEKEALNNLVAYTSGFKVTSLNIFETLMKFQSENLAKDIARRRIVDILKKNENVLDLVKAMLAATPVDPKDRVKVSDLLEGLSPNERVEVHLGDGVPKTLMLHGNRFLLQYVLKALVQNALDYSAGPIHLSLQKEQDLGVSILVSDQGTGIPAHHIQNVFEPGLSLEREAGSAGFGLALVKRIVITLHGASMSMRSKPGVGTDVKFTLLCDAGGIIPDEADMGL